MEQHEESRSEEVLSALLTPKRFEESLVHLHHIDPRPGTSSQWPTWADPDLIAAYAARGVTAPWQHQVQAAEASWAGRHVVLATATGSGKSLAAWLPAISAIRSAETGGSIAALQRRPSVLYLSPTKALAADQLHGLRGVLTAGGITDVRAATCDGDTPTDERAWVRDWADVVLTNPDFLHFSLLPGHRRWQRLLRGLRYIIIDECHAYRGVLGAHVALVLRRLLRLAAHYGSAPSAILASATTGTPEQSAARLLGVDAQDVTAITASSAPRGRTTVALWQPAILPGAEDLGWSEEATTVPPAGIPDAPRRSALSESAHLLTDLVRRRVRTLAFVRSRVGAEAIADQTRNQLSGTTADPSHQPVAAYRGGYLPEERRALEEALRSGELLAVASTNALELGVDISGLDAVLIAGWPGTRVSLWQQIGRAGRAGADGLAILVASDNPLDTYLVHHPEAIFEADVEATAFDPENPYVLAPHLCAAAAEVPLTEADQDRFGPASTPLLRDLVARGFLRRRPTGWYWNYHRPESPTDLTDLRGGGGAPVQVIEAATGRVLGTVDAGRADATVHTGAVYVHQGRTFRVDAYDDDVAAVTEVEVGYRTRAHTDKHVSIVRTGTTKNWGPVTWTYGLVDVSEQVTGYERRRLPGMDLIGTYPLELPVHTLRTAACWWHTDEQTLTDAGLTPADLPGALHAAEHAAIGLLGLIATCDRWDIGGLSTAMHPDTLGPTVFVYDAFPGGAGFAQRGYQGAHRWMAATRDAIASCPCTSGCPSCVQSPKCGNNNSPLDKDGALRVLRLLTGLTPAPECDATSSHAR